MTKGMSLTTTSNFLINFKTSRLPKSNKLRRRRERRKGKYPILKKARKVMKLKRKISQNLRRVNQNRYKTNRRGLKRK